MYCTCDLLPHFHTWVAHRLAWGEGSGSCVPLSSQQRLICLTTNIFHIFSLYILAKSLMLCKCQVWDFFCGFKFSIFCCFASLKHINNGGGFFYRTQQKYKIIRAYSNSRMHRDKKYRENVRLSCRQKRADKILTGHLKPMLKRTGGSWIESFCRPSMGITSTPKVHMLLPSTCAMKCFKHTRNFVSQRRPVALLPSPFAGTSAAAQSLSSARWWNRLSRSSNTLWGPASRPPTTASWNKNRGFVMIIPR